MYDYREAMRDDITEYIKSEGLEITEGNRDEMYDKLEEELWNTDGVTGNASGSYTFSRRAAMEYVIDNMDLLSKACNDFGLGNAMVGEKLLNDDWEWADVTIRCYLLYSVLSEVLDDLASEE